MNISADDLAPIIPCERTHTWWDWYLDRGQPARPCPLDALRANTELARWLRGTQWLAIRAARTAGHDWAEIATALNTTIDAVQTDYETTLQRQVDGGRQLGIASMTANATTLTALRHELDHQGD